MSTQFNFPANPNPGDIFILPGGGSAQWDGTEWTSLSDSSVVYPLPITQGGTGASTAAGARTNLGINTATGEFIIVDGTVAKPGLAFASEPGLGWYRSGASVVRMAAQGSQVAEFGFSNPTGSYQAMSPRATGGSSAFYMHSEPAPFTNDRTLTIYHDGTQTLLAESLSGTATAKPLALTFPAGISIPGGWLRWPSVQKPSADPNTLDDYAEGNWTPVNGASVAMTISVATYTKIGRLVHVMFQLQFAANSVGSSVTIGGLPFAGNGSLSVGYPGANLANGLYAFVQGNGINIYNGNGFATFAQLSNATLYVGGTYMTT